MKTIYHTKNNTIKKHTQIYYNAFGYDKGDFIPSEISRALAVDINHIECRGMGGNPLKDKDRIENLMAVTRKEHEIYGDSNKYKAELFKIHKAFMIEKGVKFDEDYINKKIELYT